MPTAILRGQHDGIATDEDLLDFFRLLPNPDKEFVMLLSLAIVFFVIALIAYVLGAQGVAGMSAGIGRTLLFVFLILAVLALLGGFMWRPAY